MFYALFLDSEGTFIHLLISLCLLRFLTFEKVPMQQSVLLPVHFMNRSGHSVWQLMSHCLAMGLHQQLLRFPIGRL